VVTGAAVGPYAGSFTETGTVTIGQQEWTQFGALVGPVLGFDATFTITPVAGNTTFTQVSGTMHLLATVPVDQTHYGECGKTEPPFTVNVYYAFTETSYHATIKTADGTFGDQGINPFSVVSASNTPDVVVTGGTETFASSLTQTVPVGITAGALCQQTKEFVQSSARYQALKPAQKATVDALANALCQRLAAVVPTLTPSQKAAFIAAYKQGVEALAWLGWITPSQGATLKSLADTLV
jgi:hypothetical protein